MASPARTELFNRCLQGAMEHVKRYDGSHDITHLNRVMRNVVDILNDMERRDREKLDRDLIIFAAVLHDVGDKKYHPPGTDVSSMVKQFILDRCEESEKEAITPFADKVQKVATYVSFSTEMKDKDKVCEVLEEIPELAVVQDGDRLDAIGAIGIGRAFAFGGATGRTMQGAVRHFSEKLLKLEKRMKTDEGRRLAKKRHSRVVEFSKWWHEEARLEPFVRPHAFVKPEEDEEDEKGEDQFN